MERTFMKNRYYDLGHGVTVIDNHPNLENVVGSYIIEHNGSVAFVDVGTSHSIPILMEYMKQNKISLEKVEYLFITHVHLDHAGGAGTFLKYLPNAKVILHPNGVKHLVQPEKLIASAKSVYGEEVFAREYGEIVPIPANRVIEVHDGSILSLNNRSFLFLDTPGHARHHYCIVDAKGKGIFTGDCFGLSYSFFDSANKERYILPTTTPTQFDPEEFHKTIDRLTSYKLPYMYLTHFGMIDDVENMAKKLHQSLDDFAQLGLKVEKENNRFEVLFELLKNYLFQTLQKHGCITSLSEVWKYMEADLNLSTQGLLCWLDRKKKESSVK